MKIGIHDIKPQTPLAPAGERKGAVPGKAGEGATPQPSATVSLSPLAMQAHAGAFDQAKVEKIAAAIRNGSFQINAGTIADKLIANAQELLGSSSR